MVSEFTHKIIDVHTHIFPQKVAEKATAAIGTFYGLEMSYIGYRDTLVSQMEQCGIRRCFIHSTATVPHQVRDINIFLAETIKNDADRFTAFGTVHAETEDKLGEVDFMRENGITGIKFHNDFQRFAADDERMFPVYEKAQAERIPIMFHGGDKRYSYTNPRQFLHLSKLFPNLIAIVAHLGAYSEWDKIDDEYLDTDFYFDTSSALFALSPERAREIILRHGEDKILFGTDFPMWTAEDEFKRLDTLKLDNGVLEKILFKNAENLLERIAVR